MGYSTISVKSHLFSYLLDSTEKGPVEKAGCSVRRPPRSIHEEGAWNRSCVGRLRCSLPAAEHCACLLSISCIIYEELLLATPKNCMLLLSHQTKANVKIAASWDVTPCSAMDIDRCFGKVPPKRRSISIRTDGATFLKTVILIVAAARTWNLKMVTSFVSWRDDSPFR
jgi:hypothetical protein